MMVDPKNLVDHFDWICIVSAMHIVTDYLALFMFVSDSLGDFDS